MIVTRFAPSPTGDLHFGGAFVALASWWLARREGGKFVVRMEDIDTPRVIAGSAERILDDLAWLGLTWDGEVAAQSQRTDLYVEAISQLEKAGLVYPCDCSRAELARIASAPHANEELVYPGLCASLDPSRAMKRDPALRVRVPADLQNTGDFVIRRADGIFSYQLAVTVDDTAQGITHVIRGDDLLASTPRQIFLARALGRESPEYVHLPLVLDAEGERIAKRTRGAHVRALRESGISREEMLGELTHALGLTRDAEPISPEALAKLDRAKPWPIASWRLPARWADSLTSANLQRP